MNSNDDDDNTKSEDLHKNYGMSLTTVDKANSHHDMCVQQYFESLVRSAECWQSSMVLANSSVGYVHIHKLRKIDKRRQKLASTCYCKDKHLVPRAEHADQIFCMLECWWSPYTGIQESLT